MEATDPAAAADGWIEGEMRAAGALHAYAEEVAANLFSAHITGYIHAEKRLNKYNPHIDVAARIRQHATEKQRRESAIAGIAGNIGMLLSEGGLPQEMVEDIESIIAGVLTSPRNRRTVNSLPDNDVDGAASITEQIISLPPF